MRHFIRSAAVAIAMATASTFTLSAAMAADLSGAGSTFIYPVFAKWADTYKKDTGIGLNYQSIGSGGGIKQVIAKTVTFGATDKPMSDADLEKNGLVQFPMVMGGIVPIVNLTGIKPGELVLDGKTIAQIYLGAITTWDDAAIKALNPTLTLPSTAIAVVHRSDGSGTTFNFTDYLVKLSPDWKEKVGSDTAVEWPTGVGAKGSEGVANTVKQTDGGIGYDIADAAGKVVEPSLESFGAAASNADFKGAKNFNVIITNEPGDATWPIAASTWVLIHKAPDDAAATGEALKFFAWAYKDGKETAKALDYVSIPDNVVDLIKASWKADIQADGKPVYAGE
jgi:phosphate transport system substrate-binding protein